MNFWVDKVFPSPYYLFSLPVPFDRQVAGTTAYLLIWLGLSPNLRASWAQVRFQAKRSSFPKGEDFTPRSFVSFQKARSRSLANTPQWEYRACLHQS
ncbi:hypothetical protein [Allocoleopsis sp.]|uniref:hypothetical protein n=1 Tax=Allocoleopsis sp. TaxID=3088169 RepID=UPI002FD434BD